MPLKYRIEENRKLIVSTAKGVVTFAEIKDHQDRLLSDADFHANFDQLIDVTTATDVALTAAHARIIADRQIVSKESLRAFVASLPHIYGLGRMVEAFHETRAKAAVFYEMDAALDWLEIRVYGGIRG